MKNKNLTFVTVILLAFNIFLTACGSRNGCGKDCNCNLNKLEAETKQMAQTELAYETDQETETTLDTKNEQNLSSNNNSVVDDDMAFAGRIIARYLGGGWDGLPTEIDGHKISLSDEGELLIDGYLQSNTTFHPQHPIDLPEDIWPDSSVYIPGKGTYITDDETYSLYLRGEQIELPGNPLNWKEAENVEIAYGARLYYCKQYDKMFLTTSMLQAVNDSGFPIYHSEEETYLYIFPNYDISEIELIGRLKDLKFNDAPEYTDENGVRRRYCENDNGEYYFEKVSY